MQKRKVGRPKTLDETNRFVFLMNEEQKARYDKAKAMVLAEMPGVSEYSMTRTNFLMILINKYLESKKV